MLFYKNVEALSNKTHATLKIKPTETLAFAANHYWVPIAGVEFFRAAENFPVVFLKEGDPVSYTHLTLPTTERV